MLSTGMSKKPWIWSACRSMVSTRECVDHDEQFHQVFVGRSAGGLDHEHIASANVLVDLDSDFTIGKTTHMGRAERGAEVFSNFSGQTRIGVARENHEIRRGGLHERPAV